MNVGGRDSTEYPLQKTNKHPVYLVKVVVSFGMGLSRVLMDDFISNFIRNSRLEKNILGTVQSARFVAPDTDTA